MSARLKTVDTEDAALAALADVALEISEERDKTERQIKALLEQGKDQSALRLLRKHWGLQPRLKVVK